MGNIDFNAQPGFSAYVLLLIFSGVVMLVLAATVDSTKGVRALNALFGAGFVVYGGYLAFVFDGGSYLIFFKAFILPVVMLVKTVQDRAQRKSAPTYAPPAPDAAAAPMAPPAPPAAPAPAQD